MQDTRRVTTGGLRARRPSQPRSLPPAQHYSFCTCTKGFEWLFQNFIYLRIFLTELGLHCCTQDFSRLVNRGCSLVAGHELLTAVASPVAEHRFQVLRLQWLWLLALVALRHVKPSKTRHRNCVPCVGRRILNHWTTRNVP